MEILYSLRAPLLQTLREVPQRFIAVVLVVIFYFAVIFSVTFSAAALEKALTRVSTLLLETGKEVEVLTEPPQNPKGVVVPLDIQSEDWFRQPAPSVKDRNLPLRL